jgi:hypothetical protein
MARELIWIVCWAAGVVEDRWFGGGCSAAIGKQTGVCASAASQKQSRWASVGGYCRKKGGQVRIIWWTPTLCFVKQSLWKTHHLKIKYMLLMLSNNVKIHIHTVVSSLELVILHMPESVRRKYMCIWCWMKAFSAWDTCTKLNSVYNWGLKTRHKQTNQVWQLWLTRLVLNTTCMGNVDWFNDEIWTNVK